MSVLSTQKELNHVQRVVETGLNYAGYVPGVSTLSGALRVNYGKIEIIGAVAAAAFIAIRALVNQDAQERSAGLKKALNVMSTYSLHGVANIFRGILEMIPFLSLVTCLPYDLQKNRFTYPKEDAKGLRPLQNLLPS